jgi:hypothetical protein
MAKMRFWKGNLNRGMGRADYQSLKADMNDTGCPTSSCLFCGRDVTFKQKLDDGREIYNCRKCGDIFIHPPTRGVKGGWQHASNIIPPSSPVPRPASSPAEDMRCAAGKAKETVISPAPVEQKPEQKPLLAECPWCRTKIRETKAAFVAEMAPNTPVAVAARQLLLTKQSDAENKVQAQATTKEKVALTQASAKVIEESLSARKIQEKYERRKQKYRKRLLAQKTDFGEA